jgi:flavodoxin
MRVLVAHASKTGGTVRIAEIVGATLREHGLEVEVRAAADMLDPPTPSDVLDPDVYDAVVWADGRPPAKDTGKPADGIDTAWIRNWAAQVAEELATPTLAV